MTASLTPHALPDAAEQRPFLSAPMVFEAPKPADAQVLTEMPKTEVRRCAAAGRAGRAPKQVEKPARSLRRSSRRASPPSQPAEFPKSVIDPSAAAQAAAVAGAAARAAGKDYDKAEKCLAQAIYFEARNEPARGQQAVAQVVLNRVFSPYYPKDVCSVVYQNAHRHLSLPVHLRLRRQAGGGQRARRLGARQPHRQADARRQGLAARGQQGDALSRGLCPAELDPRHEGDGALRPAHVLPPAQLGRRLERGALGHGGEFGEADRRRSEAGRSGSPQEGRAAQELSAYSPGRRT